jgi:5-methylcytosine-specific restriction endonuclease McrA
MLKELIKMICDYGCGKEAKYQFKNGKWCCGSHWLKCPNKKKNISGENNPFFNKKHSQKSKDKISNGNRGKSHIPWNKGMVGCFSGETIKKMSSSKIGRIPWNKGKEMSRDFRKKRSEYMSEPINNPAWKGGYSKKNIPLYDTYANKLTIEEKAKRYKHDREILTVVCANSECNKRFVPKLNSVIERVRCLNGTQRGEMRLYCSDNCKHSCSIYWKNPSTFINVINKNEIYYTNSEYEIFKKIVLERDNYICQYCGKLAEHVHHERPKKLEPFFSLDPDLAWSCCGRCHYEKGHKKGSYCSTGNLSNILCK